MQRAGMQEEDMEKVHSLHLSSGFLLVSHLLEVLHQIRYIILIISSLSGLISLSIGGIDLLQILQVIRSQLSDDTREEILELLGLSVTTDNIGVGSDGGLNLRVNEMNDVSIILEQIDFLDSRNVSYRQFIESGFQSLIIVSSGLSDGLSLSANGTLTTSSDCLGLLGDQLG